MDGPAPHAPLDGTVEAEVCVIGLGAAGLAAAAHLASRGADVVGIESGPIGGVATSRSAGLARSGLAAFHHDAIEILGRRRAVALHRITLEEMDRLRMSGDDEFSWPGSLRIATSSLEREDCARQYHVMQRDGLAVQHWSGPEGDGLLFPADGVVNPVLRTRRLAREAAEAGARLFAFTQAQQVGERDVDTWTGEVRCRSVIVAIDGDLERVVPALARIVHTRHVEMLATAPVREVRRSRPVIARWGHDIVRQLPDGRIVVGGRDDRGDDDTPWSLQPNSTVQAELDTLLAETFDRPLEVTHRWATATACTDDRLPVLARLGPSTIAVGALNGHGTVLGPLLGRAAADLTLGRHSELADLLQA
ncbi:MAG: FAD-binding oxidoreductase [Nitriliruptoraceae bacterium]